MAIKKYKNIFGKKINVECKPREADEVFEADGTVKEIKRLVLTKYLMEVK